MQRNKPSKRGLDIKVLLASLVLLAGCGPALTDENADSYRYQNPNEFLGTDAGNPESDNIELDIGNPNGDLKGKPRNESDCNPKTDANCAPKLIDQPPTNTTQPTLSYSTGYTRFGSSYPLAGSTSTTLSPVRTPMPTLQDSTDTEYRGNTTDYAAPLAGASTEGR